MNKNKLLALFVAMLTWVNSSEAQEIKQEIIADGLNRPAGIAFRPGDESVVIAEYGSGKIIQLGADEPKVLIDGFSPNPSDEFETDGGPLGLEFLNPNWLIVGATKKSDKKFQLLGFDIATIKEEKALQGDEPSVLLTMGEADAALEGAFFDVYSDAANFFVSGGTVEKSFIATLPKSDALPEKLQLLIPAESDAESWLAHPRAITVSNPEGFLAFIQDAQGSTLQFFTTEGEDRGSFQTGLKNVVAMVYGAKRGRLFLADRDTQAIYKLVESDNEAGCESVKVLDVANVTDMRFNSAGELIVATLGDEITADSGKVIKISGLDSEPSTENADTDSDN